MPASGTDEILAQINERAAAYGLTVKTRLLEAYFNTPDDPVVAAAAALTGRAPETVAYGTDALHLQRSFRLVVLGPGDIVQAHTVGESVGVAELVAAAEIYRQMIDRFCGSG
jgi:acetylornithine deacetylase